MRCHFFVDKRIMRNFFVTLGKLQIKELSRRKALLNKINIKIFHSNEMAFYDVYNKKTLLL